MRKVKGLVCLAARTARSNAYLQALAAARFSPEAVVLIGSDGAGRSGQLDANTDVLTEANVGSLFLPDLSRPLTSTVDALQTVVYEPGVDSVNDPRVSALLADLAPELVLFSGFGGEIVSAELCGRWPLLHLHSGWLPEYRGSTTVYYSWLMQGHCAVSAILLAPEIDAGPIIARKRFPAPPSGLNADYIYDPAIRADLLVEVVEKFYDTGVLSNAGDVAASEAGSTGNWGPNVYFVIHPTLKNLAIASARRSFR